MGRDYFEPTPGNLLDLIEEIQGDINDINERLVTMNENIEILSNEIAELRFPEKE